MKIYLFGISKYAENLMNSGALKEYKVEGLFDNSETKWGTQIFGLIVERPYYNQEIELIVSVKESYHIEILKQLMELGYRKFIFFLKKGEGLYEKKIHDYSGSDYEKDKKNLVLLFLEHRSYSNICALEYMVKNKLVNAYSYRIKVIESDKESDDYKYELVAAKYIITERWWHVYDPAVKAKVIQCWHGFPLKTMGHMLYNYDKITDGFIDYEWEHFDYILSYGINYNTFMSACYGTIQNRYAITGMPRNDLLFYTDGKKNLEEVMPECKGKKVVFYMPTFREMRGIVNGEKKGYLFYWSDFDIEILQEFCRERNLFFLFKLHPCDISKVSEWCVKSDCMGALTDEMLGDKCMYEYLNAADFLITDYSSVYFDYMLLNRPIIFTNKDEESYGSGRGFIMEPIDFWRPGPIVHTMDKIFEEIDQVLNGEDIYCHKREELLPFVHRHTNGGSTQRLFDLMKRESLDWEEGNIDGV